MIKWAISKQILINNCIEKMQRDINDSELTDEVKLMLMKQWLYQIEKIENREELSND